MTKNTQFCRTLGNKLTKEVIIKSFKFLLLIFICVAIGCQQLSTEAEATSELPVMLNLHPAIENGFDVTQVIVTITRDQFISSLNLTIGDTLAYGTFYDLEPGIYDISVEVYEEDLLIATGTGTGEVIAGETTTVEIELVFVPLTGNLQIIVNWGGFITPLPHRILFIGNSITYYNGGVELHTMNLANSIDSTLAVTCESIVGGGFTLEQHYNLPATLQLIADGNYDIVILQEMTSRPVNDPDLFYEYATLLDSVITEAGAQTMFFFSWPFESIFDEMIEQQAAAYNYIGQLLDAPVIPVARAWQLSLQQNPALNLYMPDGNHPNVYGTYLACCTFYPFLWDDSPVGAEYVNDLTITPEEKLFLQTIAWETYGIYGE